MSNQLLTDQNALRMFFTEPVYQVNAPAKATATLPTAAEPSASLSASGKEFEFIGDNGRHILILVNDEHHAVSSPEGALLLKNILKHLQLTKADFALVNFSRYPGTTFGDLHNFFNIKTALIFGLQSTELSIDAPPADFISLQDTQIVFAANLASMHADVHAKKQFFKALSAVSTW